MSSRGRGLAAKAHDNYPTPIALVRAGYEMLGEHHGAWLSTVDSVLEPGAGPGTFCHVAKRYCKSLNGTVVGVDPFPPKERYEYHLIQQDFLQWNTQQKFRLIITNPPFTLSEDFIRKSQDLLTPDGKMLYLLRIGMAASKKRRELWESTNLEEIWMCRKRPGFTRNGSSDSSEYAFFLIDNQREKCSQDTRFRWVDW